MVEKKDDGWPAFPQVPCPDCGVRHEPEHVPGMTLRDYFAAVSLPEAIRHEREIRAERFTLEGFRYNAVAHAAYVMAEAMLKARG